MTAPRQSVAQQYGDLLAQRQASWARCADCGRAHFYPREYCPHCLSDAVTAEPVRSIFRVRTFTHVYRPQRPAPGGLPVLLIAGEAEGVTIIAEGSGWDGRECSIGASIRLVVNSSQQRLPVFAPAGDGNGG